MGKIRNCFVLCAVLFVLSTFVACSSSLKDSESESEDDYSYRVNSPMGVEAKNHGEES